MPRKSVRRSRAAAKTPTRKTPARKTPTRKTPSRKTPGKMTAYDVKDKKMTTFVPSQKKENKNGTFIIMGKNAAGHKVAKIVSRAVGIALKI